jgi:hypothetical protein
MSYPNTPLPGLAPIHPCPSLFSFFLSLFLIPTSVYLLIVDVLLHLITTTHLLGRAPVGEGSARCRDLYLTTHNSQNKQTFMLPAWFEHTILAGEWPQTLVLDRAANGNGVRTRCLPKIPSWCPPICPLQLKRMCGAMRGLWMAYHMVSSDWWVLRWKDREEDSHGLVWGIMWTFGWRVRKDTWSL